MPYNTLRDREIVKQGRKTQPSKETEVDFPKWVDPCVPSTLSEPLCNCPIAQKKILRSPEG